MKKTLNIAGKLLDLSIPKVMGILNATPDSFYADSRVPFVETAYKKAELMLNEGAMFLDIGGYSTRPGADKVPESEEIERVLPIIEMITKNFPEAIISIDTFRSKVAREAVKAGAKLINDVSGGNIDPQMFETVAELNVPYIMMHSRGDEENLTNKTDYQNVTTEVILELQAKMAKLYQLGVKDIVIDPGFGFSKSMVQNYELLNNLEALAVLDVPILTGLSRKSMIWRYLDISANEALNGTTVLNTIAIQKGSSILRVHDVKAAIEIVKLTEKLKM